MRGSDLRKGKKVYTSIPRLVGGREIECVEEVTIDGKANARGKWFIRTKDGERLIKTVQSLREEPDKKPQKTWLNAYHAAIDWVAVHDNPGNEDALDPEAVERLKTTKLIAGVFDLPEDFVAKLIVNRRQTLL